MIYDQFQRLHPDTPRVREGRPVFMTSQSVTTKPITPLLLVNKRMGSEYKNSCKKRLGVIVSSSMDNLAPGAEFEEEIYPWDAEKASFIHMHAGDWMYRHRLDDPEWTLSPLKDWLARQDLRMPNLDSITVRIYLSLGSLKSLGDGRSSKTLCRISSRFQSSASSKSSRWTTSSTGDGASEGQLKEALGPLDTHPRSQTRADQFSTSIRGDLLQMLRCIAQ